jgi:hypothetical protein
MWLLAGDLFRVEQRPWILLLHFPSIDHFTLIYNLTSISMEMNPESEMGQYVENQS